MLHFLDDLFAGRLKLPLEYTVRSVELGSLQGQLRLVLSCWDINANLTTVLHLVSSGGIVLPRGYELHGVELVGEGEFLLLLFVSSPIVNFMHDVCTGRLVLPQGYGLRSVQVDNTVSELLTVRLSPLTTTTTSQSPIVWVLLQDLITGRFVIPCDFKLRSVERAG